MRFLGVLIISGGLAASLLVAPVSALGRKPVNSSLLQCLEVDKGREESAAFCNGLRDALQARLNADVALTESDSAPYRVRVSLSPRGWTVAILDEAGNTREGPFEHEVMDAEPDADKLDNFPDFIADRLVAGR